MRIVIIGNGISGITAARWLRKLSDHEIIVISSESKYFYSRTALMYIYMGHMQQSHIQPYEDWFWEKNRINLMQDHVESINFDEKSISLQKGNSLSYDKLILALGSKSNKFGWPGQDLKGVGGLYSLQDLEQMEKYSAGLSRAVVVGGGLIGIEMAEMFHSRHIPVTLLIREAQYWDNVLPTEEAAMISQHIINKSIDLRTEQNLQEIIDDGHGQACAIIVKETGERIDCGFVGLTPGVSPNVAFLKDSGLEIERGILVNKYLETNIANVYAIGDCVQQTEPVEGRKAIEAVWYTGRMMGETVAYNITGHSKAYDPGIWFNSAKFLDIEYQVYGYVPNVDDPDLESLFWTQDGDKSIRINYDKSSGIIKGFNLMGIRFRHEVCNKWIKDGSHIEDVLKDLRLANFDPEFYKTYESELLAAYEKKTGKKLQLRAKSKLNQVLSFLKS